MSSGPRFQYTLDHYAQLTLPNFKSVSPGTGFVAQSFDIPFDQASANTSDRSVSPKSQPWERRPSLKSLPFAGQYRPPQECFSESSSVSSITRPVSPKSVPRSSTARLPQVRIQIDWYLQFQQNSTFPQRRLCHLTTTSRRHHRGATCNIVCQICTTHSPPLHSPPLRKQLLFRKKSSAPKPPTFAIAGRTLPLTLFTSRSVLGHT